MPNIKSSKKSVKTDAKTTLLNNVYTAKVKNSIKNFYNDNIDYDLEKLVIVYYDKDSNKGEIKYIFTNEKQEIKPLEYGKKKYKIGITTPNCRPSFKNKTAVTFS